MPIIHSPRVGILLCLMKPPLVITHSTLPVFQATNSTHRKLVSSFEAVTLLENLLDAVYPCLSPSLTKQEGIDAENYMRIETAAPRSTPTSIDRNTSAMHIHTCICKQPERLHICNDIYMLEEGERKKCNVPLEATITLTQQTICSVHRTLTRTMLMDILRTVIHTTTEAELCDQVTMTNRTGHAQTLGSFFLSFRRSQHRLKDVDRLRAIKKIIGP